MVTPQNWSGLSRNGDPEPEATRRASTEGRMKRERWEIEYIQDHLKIISSSLEKQLIPGFGMVSTPETCFYFF